MRLLSGVAVVVAGFAAASVAVAHDPDGYDSIFTNAILNDNCEGSNSGVPNVGGDMFCLNDNASMSFWLAPGGMATAEKNLVRSVLSNEYDDTDLNPQEVTNVVWSEPGLGETDLIMDEVDLQGHPHNLPSGFYGVAWCQDEYGILRCDQSYAFIDNNVNGTLPGGQGGPTYFSAVACHEIGHTVGLTHPQQAWPVQSYFDSRFRCLNEDLLPGDFGYTGPGGNNKHQINDWY